MSQVRILLASVLQNGIVLPVRRLKIGLNKNLLHVLKKECKASAISKSD